MTPDELARAADQLAPVAPANGLPPMAVADVLDGIAEDVRLNLGDLWTLRDALDVGTVGPVHAAAVADLVDLAEHLAGALDAARRIAAGTGHTVPMDRPGADPW